MPRVTDVKESHSSRDEWMAVAIAFVLSIMLRDASHGAFYIYHCCCKQASFPSADAMQVKLSTRDRLKDAPMGKYGACMLLAAVGNPQAAVGSPQAEAGRRSAYIRSGQERVS
eukprot:1159187-Pelagomonas_calceolata.AAC.2